MASKSVRGLHMLQQHPHQALSFTTRNHYPIMPIERTIRNLHKVSEMCTQNTPILTFSLPFRTELL